MPKKASFAPKDQSKGGFGMQEGNGEITNAVVRIHQYPPSSKTGKQAPPFVCIQLEIAHLDNNWEIKPDDEPELLQYGVGRDKWSVINGECHCKFHAGEAKDATDGNVKDLGHDLGTEGNCLAVLDDSSHIHEKTNWAIFSTRLKEAGFKEDVLANGYIPDLIGLKAHFKTYQGDKFTAADGTEGQQKCLVVDKIEVYPYERKDKKGKAAPKAAVKGNGSAADIEIHNAAVGAIKDTLSNPKHGLKGKENVDRATFQKSLMNQMMLSKIKTATQKPILDLIRDDDSLMELASEVGFMLDVETNTLNFNV